MTANKKRKTTEPNDEELSEFVPRIVAVAPPKEGNAGYRVGLSNGRGGAFAYLRVSLLNVPPGATTTDLRNGLPLAMMLTGSAPGEGPATWLDPDATVPVLVGLSYDAQWWIRDFAAAGGVARSNFVRITIE